MVNQFAMILVVCMYLWTIRRMLLLLPSALNEGSILAMYIRNSSDYDITLDNKVNATILNYGDW